MAERMYYDVPPAPMPGAPEELAELLEVLHRSGTLRTLKGFFGRLGDVSQVAMTEANSEAGHNLIGVLLFLGECAAQVPPDDLPRAAAGLADGLRRAKEAKKQKPPSLFGLWRLLRAPETRRALATLLTILNRMGAAADRTDT